MKEYLDRILELPTRQKLGLLLGTIILLIVFDYFFVFTRFSVRISELSQEVDAARSELEKKKAIVANKPQLLAQLAVLQGRYKEAMAQLPDEKEIPKLLTDISNKARESGLDVLLFRPRAENPQDFYAEVPVDVALRGGFHNMVSFFDEVGRLNRVVNITNIEMKNPKTADDQVSVDAITLVTAFRFLSDAERAKIAAQKAAKEKAAKN